MFDKKTKQLIFAFILLIILSIGVTYYKYIVFKDYIIFTE